MRNFVQSVPLVAILLPLMGAITIPVFKGKNAPRTMALSVLAVVVVLTGLLTFQMFKAPFDFTFSMGKFPAPIGNELRAGGVESVLSLVFSVVMLLSIVGGFQEAERDVDPSRRKYYYLMLCLLLSTLMAITFTNDFFTAYVFMEINAIAACALVVAKENGQTLKAGLKYLVMSIIGSSLFLLGVTMLYSITGHLLMEPALKVLGVYGKTGQYHFSIVVILALFFVGLGIKSALFPFHTWLPDAHGSATSTSSAILSGLVLKGYVVLLIKLLLRVFGLQVIGDLGVLPVLSVLGMLAMLVASVLAIRQTDIKRRIAYSTVAQIGYIYLGLSMGTVAGYSTALYHVMAHAVTKAMLFIAVGSLIETAGSKKIKDLAGAGFKNKPAAIAFGVGALSMTGVPFFAGFSAKAFLGAATLGSSIGLLSYTAIALSGFLNALYYLPVLISLFREPEEVGGEGAAVKRVASPKGSRYVLLAIVLFILAHFILGVGSNKLFRLLENSLGTFAIPLS